MDKNDSIVVDVRETVVMLVVKGFKDLLTGVVLMNAHFYFLPVCEVESDFLFLLDSSANLQFQKLYYILDAWM
jgi:hypothetical protein